MGNIYKSLITKRNMKKDVLGVFSILILSIFLIGLFSLGGVSAGDVCSFNPTSLCSGLSAYWNFDILSGSNSGLLVDLIGGNNGTVYGATPGVAGIKNQAYLFDGVNDYILIGKVSKFDVPPITLGAWVKYTATQDAGIVSKFDVQNYNINPEPYGDEGYSLRVREGTGSTSAGTKLGVTSCDADVPITTLASSKNDGNWHFIVGVFEATSNKIYVDGVLINSGFGKDFNIFWADFLIGALDHVPTSAPDPLNSDVLGFFNGSIDEVAVWNRVLTDIEISQLYDSYLIKGNVNPYWENMVGQKISKAQFGDTVKMIATGQGFNISKSMNYTLYKDSGWWFIKWTTPISPILSEDIWQVPSDLEVLDSVYFIAQQDSIMNTSETMNITNYNNSMPFVNITSPSEGGYVAGDNEILFYYSAYDEDDLLELTWDFGDGESLKVYNYSLPESIPVSGLFQKHFYNSSGVYEVTLTAKEMTRNQSSSVTRKIYVFKTGINVFPIITSPQKNVGYGNFVNFDASQSFVANCSIINCEYPYTCVPFGYFPIPPLYCKYLLAPGNTTFVGNLSATWSVYSGSNSALSLSKTGSWNNNSADVVKFTHFFDKADNYKATLKLDYN